MKLNMCEVNEPVVNSTSSDTALDAQSDHGAHIHPNEQNMSASATPTIQIYGRSRTILSCLATDCLSTSPSKTLKKNTAELWENLGPLVQKTKLINLSYVSVKAAHCAGVTAAHSSVNYKAWWENLNVFTQKRLGGLRNWQIESSGGSQVELWQLKCKKGSGESFRHSDQSVQNESGLLPSGWHFRAPVMRPKEHKVSLLSVATDRPGY